MTIHIVTDWLPFTLTMMVLSFWVLLWWGGMRQVKVNSDKKQNTPQ